MSKILLTLLITLSTALVFRTRGEYDSSILMKVSVRLTASRKTALKKLRHRRNPVHRTFRLPSLFLTITCTIDVIVPDIVNVFYVWSTLAGYEELAGGFQPKRNREIFWMNNNNFWPVAHLLLTVNAPTLFRPLYMFTKISFCLVLLLKILQRKFLAMFN